jgi:glycerol-3-phosphate acyltransferase PlsY
MSGRGQRRWGSVRTCLALDAAFAAGCLPSGRLVTRLATGKELDELGDRKPGSANVGRSVGWGAGAATLALDAAKAYVPASLARAAGAPRGVVSAMGISTMLGHILVVRGRGAASALGAAYAIDARAMTVCLVPLVGGTLLHRHPQAVAVTAVCLPVSSALLRRDPRPVVWLTVLITVIFAARLRGTAGTPFPATTQGWLRRLWLDRDD